MSQLVDFVFLIHIDSGTTNTRAYLIQDETIFDCVKGDIGSRDSSISGSNQVLLNGIKTLINELLARNHAKECDVERIFASGMVTSPYGICEVPHLCVPVSAAKLAGGMYRYEEPMILNKPIDLIRGVKTVPDEFCVTTESVDQINNMRGEEIEVFGILSMLPQEKLNAGWAIFLPGSHTHVVYTRQGEIQDILSTFSGELFSAIATGTLLASSIQFDVTGFDADIVRQGFRALREYGVSRALYLVNTLRLFSSLGRLEKTCFLEGVIVGGVVEAFMRKKRNWPDLAGVVVATKNPMAEIYRIVLQEAGFAAPVEVVEPLSGQEFAVKGLLALLKMEGK